MGFRNALGSCCCVSGIPAERYNIVDYNYGTGKVATLFKTPAIRKTSVATNDELIDQWSLKLPNIILPDGSGTPTTGRFWKINGSRVTNNDKLWVVGYHLWTGANATDPTAQLFSWPGYAYVDVSDFNNPVLLYQDAIDFRETFEATRFFLGDFNGEWDVNPVFSDCPLNAAGDFGGSAIFGNRVCAAGDGWFGKFYLAHNSDFPNYTGWPTGPSWTEPYIQEMFYTGYTGVRSEVVPLYVSGWNQPGDPMTNRWSPIAASRSTNRCLGFRIVSQTGGIDSGETVLTGVDMSIISGPLAYDTGGDVWHVEYEYDVMSARIESIAANPNDNLLFNQAVLNRFPVVIDYDVDPVNFKPHFIIVGVSGGHQWDVPLDYQIIPRRTFYSKPLHLLFPETGREAAEYYDYEHEEVDPGNSLDVNIDLHRPWKIWPIRDTGVASIRLYTGVLISDITTGMITCQNNTGLVMWEYTGLISMRDETALDVPFNQDNITVQCVENNGNPYVYIDNCWLFQDYCINPPLGASYTLESYPDTLPTQADGKEIYNRWVTDFEGTFFNPVYEQDGNYLNHYNVFGSDQDGNEAENFSDFGMVSDGLGKCTQAIHPDINEPASPTLAYLTGFE